MERTFKFISRTRTTRFSCPGHFWTCSEKTISTFVSNQLSFTWVLTPQYILILWLIKRKVSSPIENLLVCFCSFSSCHFLHSFSPPPLCTYFSHYMQLNKPYFSFILCNTKLYRFEIPRCKPQINQSALNFVEINHAELCKNNFCSISEPQ